MKQTAIKQTPITAIFNGNDCWELINDDSRRCEHYIFENWGYEPAQCRAFDHANVDKGRCAACIALFGKHKKIDYEAIEAEKKRKLDEMNTTKCPLCGGLADRQIGLFAMEIINGKTTETWFYKCRKYGCDGRFGFTKEAVR